MGASLTPLTPPMALVLASYHGFNLDVDEPVIFQEDAAGFGQSVMQFGGSRLVVGAPLAVVSANHTGRLYECAPASGTCTPIFPFMPPEAVNMSLGLSLAASPNHSQLLACGPTVHRACGEDVYAQGFCVLLDEGNSSGCFPCPDQEMDIVFLIDGSGSISSNDFRKMKDFVRAVMDQFKDTNTQFSLMQYSNVLVTHFTFSSFRNSSNPQGLVEPIVQLTGLTFTATGILKVVTELFQTKNGARESAKKILIVITDGQKYKDPLHYSAVIPQAEQAGIIRYAIGVGDAFQKPTARQELDTIASEPPDAHVFQVDNFSALSSIQKQLYDRIFAVEGKLGGTLAGSRPGPLSIGILPPRKDRCWGAVGSFDWSGGAFLYPPGGEPHLHQHPRAEPHPSGYSSQLVLWKGVQSLVLGAPRYEHTGKVVLFTQTSTHWEMRAEVTGTQIGSYFGSSLCSVDVDRDGSTDLVLIGAPHYYEQTRGGRVSVCPLPRGQAPWRCERVLRGEQGHPWGRFGAALTVLGDVNGDKLADVAIGAPGEQENRGAVYLFHGAPGLDMSPTHSQVRPRALASPSFSFLFLGLSERSLLSLTLAAAIPPPSRVLFLELHQPVLKVGVAMRFSPVEVAKAVFQHCREASGALEAGEATVCLTVHKTSPDQLGECDVQSSISYDLALDPGRLVSRAIFQETQNQTLTRRKTLGLGRHCETMRLLLPDCVEDVVNPIVLHLNFSLEGQPILSSQNLRPVLATGSQDHFIASLPFEKNCGQDRLCEGDLSISFNFSGLNTLLVGLSLELTVTVTVRNEGEDSYGTAITLYYPAGLSYRRVHNPGSAPLHLACEAVPTESEGLRSTSWQRQPPHLSKGGGTFVVKFDVSSKASLGDRLLMGASASSENNKPASNKTSFELELPVKYAVYMMITRHEGSTRFFNFSTSAEKSSKEAEHRYRVNNLSLRDVAVSVDFWAPVQLNGAAVWDVAVEAPAQVPASPRWPGPGPTARTPWQGRVPGSPVLDCSVAHCLRFRCHIPSFSAKEELHFTLKGNLSFAWVSQMLQKKVSVVSVAEITFNRAVYSQVPGEEPFMRAQVETVLEEYEEHDPVPLVVGSCVGGLLLLALISATLYKVSVWPSLHTTCIHQPSPDRRQRDCSEHRPAAWLIVGSVPDWLFKVRGVA
uniref:Integrin subunit alpha D n=1 Tax=Oryctolagus cuniculus TaxID=9986 RepID=A0A5F9CUP6_RABIT